MDKKAMIIALAEDWTGISRLPAALKRAGFSVAALCPRRSFLAKTKFIDRLWTYPTFTYSRSKFLYLLIVFALWRIKPDVIIPGDENALVALQNIARILKKFGVRGLANSIRSSIPVEEFDQVVQSKSLFNSKCQEWGVRVPRNERVKTLEEALKISPEFGYPLVVKYDFGFGSSGVTVCKNEEELKTAYTKFNGSQWKARAKRYVLNMLFIMQAEDVNGVSLQRFVQGPVGLAPFCSVSGEMYAVNPMIKLRTHPGPTGPSSVCQGVVSDEIKEAARKTAAHLKLTGFGSLDFVINESDGLVYVIELNPRPVPTSHLDKNLTGVDLCEELFKGLNGEKPTIAAEFKQFTLALFPNEMRRDSQSEFLTFAYHDIPANDPDLFEALKKT